MKKIELEIEGVKREAKVVSAQGVLWVHMDGETFTYEPARRTSRKGGRGGGSANPGEIAAPMPGKIIKILVQKGEKVKPGQVLLVMEAMKMEYTLKAQAEGDVLEIRCQAGEQVPLGQVLVQLSV